MLNFVIGILTGVSAETAQRAPTNEVLNKALGVGGQRGDNRKVAAL
jgi:hypothetical protein